MAKSYDVTIQFVSSDPAHRYHMTSGAEATKHAKALAEEQKGKTVEVYATWFARGSNVKQSETRRFRWDDKAGKVKERS